MKNERLLIQLTILAVTLIQLAVPGCAAIKSAFGGVTATTQTTASNIVEIVTIPLR